MDNIRLLAVIFGQFSPFSDLSSQGVRFGFQTLSKNVFFMSSSLPQNQRKIHLSHCLWDFLPTFVPFCLHRQFFWIKS